MFRFDYPVPFLKWYGALRESRGGRGSAWTSLISLLCSSCRLPLNRALQPPGYNPNFHIGVRSTKTKKLLGFITGIPVEARVYAE